MEYQQDYTQIQKKKTIRINWFSTLQNIKSVNKNQCLLDAKNEWYNKETKKISFIMTSKRINTSRKEVTQGKIIQWKQIVTERNERHNRNSPCVHRLKYLILRYQYYQQ